MMMGAEDRFAGVVDLVKMKAIRWSEEDQGATFVYEDVPADLLDPCLEMREQLLEAAARPLRVDRKYLNGEALTEKRSNQGFVYERFGMKLFRVGWFSIQNKGVQAVLDAVVDYLPAPTEVKGLMGFLRMA